MINLLAYSDARRPENFETDPGGAVLHNRVDINEFEKSRLLTP